MSNLLKLFFLLKVDRDSIFEDSCKIIKGISSSRLKGSVTVQFNGEEGMVGSDSGFLRA